MTIYSQNNKRLPLSKIADNDMFKLLQLYGMFDKTDFGLRQSGRLTVYFDLVAIGRQFYNMIVNSIEHQKQSNIFSFDIYRKIEDSEEEVKYTLYGIVKGSDYYLTREVVNRIKAWGLWSGSIGRNMGLDSDLTGSWSLHGGQTYRSI